MIRSALALLLLCLTAVADLRTITVSGQFTQQGNAGYFGLALPIEFDFFVQYDDKATDSDPTPQLGVYETEGAYGGLSFGTGLGFHWIPFTNTEVRVINLPGFQAIGFGSEDAVTAYGLNIDPYRIYALFPNLFFPVSGWDDSLHWVEDMAGDFRFELMSYVFVFGRTFGTNVDTWLQTGSAQSYSVE